MRITVSLLGTPRVKIDSSEIVFPYRKAEGLFYYLCVKGMVSRDEAISIFWADCAENAARKNLRDAVYHLKRMFGDNVISSEGNNRIVLSYELFDAIDYHQLTDENIVETYTERFLGYFYIKQCYEFEAWVLEICDDLMQQFLKAVEKRIAACSAAKDVKRLSQCGQALLHHHICDENYFRSIMRGMRDAGCGEDAVNLYQKLREMLKLELEAEPEDATNQLFRSIQSLIEREKTTVSPASGSEKFFCREAELLAIMDELYFFQTDGLARSVLLTGEAGVGKTAIIRRISEKVASEQLSVISYQCVQTEETLCLKPWQDVIFAIEDLSPDSGARPRFSPRLVGQSRDSAMVAPQYELYIESLLHTLTRKDNGRRVLLIFDDVQWLDRTSRKLLSSLIQWAGNKRVLFILTSRAEGLENSLEMLEELKAKNLLRILSVDHFSLEETARIVRAQQPKLLESESVLSKIYQSTGGNALFLFELLRELEHGGSFGSLAKRADGIIQGRLADINEDEKKLLECISMYPRFAMPEELVLMTGKSTSEIFPGLNRLLVRHLIQKTELLGKEGFGFQHQLIREYVYNKVPRDTRKQLHRMLAEHYEKEYLRTRNISLCPMLIYHYEKCRDAYKYYTYQLEYLQMFYSVEHEIYPTVLTAGYSSPALPSLSGEDELVALAEKIRLLHQKSPDAAPLRMKVEYLIGRYDLFSGELKKGLNNIYASIALAKEQNDSKCLLDNFLQIVFYAIQIHDMELFNDYLMSCEELLQKSEFSDADQYTVIRLRGVYYMKKGKYQSAENIFKNVIRKTEEKHKDDPAYQVGLGACYNYIGEGYQAENEPERALIYFLHAISCCNDSKAINSKGVFYTNAGFTLYHLGEEDQAQIYIDKAIRCFENSNALWGRAKAHSYAALLAISRKDTENAKKHFEEAKKSAFKGGNPDSLALIDEITPLIADYLKSSEALHRTG